VRSSSTSPTATSSSATSLTPSLALHRHVLLALGLTEC